MTDNEKKRVNGFLGQKEDQRKVETANFSVKALPDSVNWVEKGAVSPV